MKDRAEVCKYYICAGACEKNRKASHFGYCQRCDKYEPRARKKHRNNLKDKLNKIIEKEANQDY